VAGPLTRRGGSTGKAGRQQHRRKGCWGGQCCQVRSAGGWPMAKGKAIKLGQPSMADGRHVYEL
jgi:hypothetical protein